MTPQQWWKSWCNHASQLNGRQTPIETQWAGPTNIILWNRRIPSAATKFVATSLLLVLTLPLNWLASTLMTAWTLLSSTHLPHCLIFHFLIVRLMHGIILHSKPYKVPSPFVHILLVLHPLLEFPSGTTIFMQSFLNYKIYVIYHKFWFMSSIFSEYSTYRDKQDPSNCQATSTISNLFSSQWLIPAAPVLIRLLPTHSHNSVAIDSLYYSHALHRWWHHHSDRSPLAYVWLQLHMTLQQMTTSGKIQLGPQNIHLLDNQYFHWLPLTMALQCIVPVLLAFSYHNYHLTHRFLTVPNTTTDKKPLTHHNILILGYCFLTVWVFI